MQSGRNRSLKEDKNEDQVTLGLLESNRELKTKESSRKFG